jgi:hypothetical protein
MISLWALLLCDLYGLTGELHKKRLPSLSLSS